jgi:hypothetical protein
MTDRGALIFGSMSLVLVGVIIWNGVSCLQTPSQERIGTDEARYLAGELGICQMVRDSLEGRLIDLSILGCVKSVDGTPMDPGLLLGKNHSFSFVLVFSDTGCNLCTHQELEMIERDTLLPKFTNVNTVYVSSGSLRTLRILQRARLLRNPVLSDTSDGLRKGLGLQGVSPIELIIHNRRIVYASAPTASAPGRSIAFLKRLHALASDG